MPDLLPVGAADLVPLAVQGVCVTEAVSAERKVTLNNDCEYLLTSRGRGGGWVPWPWRGDPSCPGSGGEHTCGHENVSSGIFL